jgi:GDP-mannose 6-dehydrogenase
MDIKISIIGLGYVGCISMACISKMGHKVEGIDNNKLKVESINKGLPTIIENEVGSLILKGVNNGLISATLDISSAIIDSNVTFICVNTPNTSEGDLDHSQIYNVAIDIGKAIFDKNTHHTILIRSTVSPGTGVIVEGLIEKYSNKQKGVDFDVISNPEFLREGVAVSDFFNPGMTVLGITDNTSALSIELLSRLYGDIKAPIFKVKRETSETIKYVSNSWHAVKISFANEVSRICNSLNVDPFDLMELFCKDDKLNISDKYLKPGFAYGGSCLPKDILGLTSLAKLNDIKTPLLDGAMLTNSILIDQAYEAIIASGYKKLGFIGLAFKEGTADLRGSPLLALAKKLEKNKLEIDYYDEFVNKSISSEVNLKLIKDELGSIYHRLNENVLNAISGKNLIIIGRPVEADIFLSSELNHVIDLVNGAPKDRIFPERVRYQGLNWK